MPLNSHEDFALLPVLLYRLVQECTKPTSTLVKYQSYLLEPSQLLRVLFSISRQQEQQRKDSLRKERTNEGGNETNPLLQERLLLQKIQF